MMSNSGLVTYTKISPNKTIGRGGKTITKFTPHHAAGNTSVETLGTIFAPSSRQASSQYGIGSDGRIGQYVDEKDRAWTSSSSANDSQAITVEVANDTNAPNWTVSTKAYNALIDLIVDCCRRNPGITQKDGKPGIYCDDTPNASLTFHKYFSATGCAQPYLWTRRQEICAAVNARLNGSVTTVPSPTGSNDETIWNFLKGKGLNDYAIAGVMGNMFAESGLIPNNLQNAYETKLGMNDAQYTAAVDNGTYKNFVNDSAGYGLVQWTYYSRKQALLDFAKAANASIGSMTMQLDFFWKELQGYTAVINTLKSAKSVLEASNVVLLQYERPADQSVAVQTKRAGYGQTYYDKFAGKSTTPVTPAPALNEVYQVNVSTSLNCRSGAGTTFSILGSFKAKEVVTATQKNNGWLYVSNGKISGWASADYLVLLTVKGALDKLVKEGIVNSPDLWQANSTKINYLDRLIINMGYADKKTIEGTDIKTAEAAIDKMVAKGLINSPDYWKANYKNIEWLDVFLIKVANRL